MQTANGTIHADIDLYEMILCIFVLSSIPLVTSWYELNTRATCLFPSSVENCTEHQPSRLLHKTTDNGTHIFLFGGRKNVLFNTSIHQNIGQVPHWRSTSISATVSPGSSLCRHLSDCWYRGVCTTNRTCSCTSGYYGHDCSLEEDVIILDDFWIYDIVNQVWMQVPKTKSWPMARVLPSMVVYDNRLILFGGYSQLCVDFCNDVWEYRLQAGYSPDGRGGQVYRGIGWTELGSGPGKRWRAESGLWNESMIIHGGHHLHESLSEVWEFSLRSYQWTYRNTIAKDPLIGVPVSRLGHAVAIYSNHLYIYGGINTQVNRTTQEPSLSDFWKLNLITNKWTRIHGPREPGTPQSRTGIQFSVIGKYLYMFGGFYDENFFDDTWQYDLANSKWSILQTPGRAFVPEKRMSYTLTGSTPLNMLVLIAGYGRDASAKSVIASDLVFNDVWAIELDDCVGSKRSGGLPCSGNGVCRFGKCFCNENWFDDDCSMKVCPGDVCSFVDRLPACVHCHDRGTCQNGVCHCFNSYAGAQCQLPNCPSANCSNSQHGICYDQFPNTPTCTCTPEFYGEGCNLVSCPRNCSGHGTCEPLGTCICDPAVYSGFRYTGSDCSNFVFFKDDSVASYDDRGNIKHIQLLVIAALVFLINIVTVSTYLTDLHPAMA